MKILVINAGSSSLKYQLIDMETEGVLAKGGCERIGIAGSLLKAKGNGKEKVYEQDMPNHKVAIELVLEALHDDEIGVIKSMEEIDAVGHRIVASGEYFKKTTLVTPEVLKTLEEKTFELAPLHNPAAATAIRACMEVMPKTPMALVFDSSFHATMPEKAYLYGIAYEDYKAYGVRKYGAHGTSHKFVSQEAAKYLGKKPEELKIVTCHLGNGSSITAVDGGKCVDTSMGFTPLAGVLMGTRSGDIDASAVEFLARKKGMTHAEVVTYLNKKCGVAGISGVSSDFRDLIAGMENGNERCKLALDMFNYQTKRFVGAYAAAMGGLDCIVFTAGIGENTPQVREGVCEGLEFLGVKLDKAKNVAKNDGGIRDISAEGSRVKILVIPTNEELVIARETAELL
ncbi:MAG TPA: acetate kinase [Candidatus Coproplasma stercorigallinarum]|nr:acetate kinase [Candidatus Coproplasma stercorigallinarum]